MYLYIINWLLHQSLMPGTGRPWKCITMQAGKCVDLLYISNYLYLFSRHIFFFWLKILGVNYNFVSSVKEDHES